MSGHRVYFARRDDGTGPIKIGCSAAVESRLYQLGVDYRAAFVAIADAPGDFLTEHNVQLKFAKYRVDLGVDKPGATEWFAPVPKLMAFIEKVKATGKLPLSKADQRQWIFAERYLAGETLQQIADDYGITRERVRQVLRKIGVPSLGWRPETMGKPHELTADEISAAKEYNAGTPPKELFAKYGVKQHQLLAAVRRLGFEVKTKGDWLRKFDDAKVVEFYRAGMPVTQISDKLGLTHSTYIYRILKRHNVKPVRLPTSGNFGQRADAA